MAADHDLELLTPDEAATILKGNKRTMEGWRVSGTGPAYVKIGHKVAYTRASLEAWCDQQTRRHTHDQGVTKRRRR
jgi:hypothetical protein